MNGPCRETSRLRANSTYREQGFAPLQGHHKNTERYSGNQEQEERELRQIVLCWLGYLGALRDLLIRPRLPEKYYQYLESVGVSRGLMVFLFCFFIALGPASYRITSNLLKSSPDMIIITQAQASETVQSNKYSKTDKLGYFVEDCY